MKQKQREELSLNREFEYFRKIFKVFEPGLFINVTAKTQRRKEYCHEKNVAETLDGFFGTLDLPVLQSLRLCVFAVMNYSGENLADLNMRWTLRNFMQIWPWDLGF